MKYRSTKSGIIPVVALVAVAPVVIFLTPNTLADDGIEPSYQNKYVTAETQMCTPTPTIKPTNTPTPTLTPTPTPTPVPDCLFEEEATPQAIYEEALAQGKVNPPTKKHITRRSGVCNGPSGRETYYNLKMDLVVKYMRKLGYKEKDYPYWVRDDGAKMLGNYVMVAANLKIRPKGTILECSLGTAIVCDTGGFVKKYPKGLDIAVNW